MNREGQKQIRCVDCYKEFSRLEIEGAKACPACGSKGVPMLISQDVTIRINWHELRILAIWASRWADKENFPDDGRATLQNILKRLRTYRPAGSAPLTLIEEFKELQKTFPGAELRDEQGNVIVPPKENGP